MITQHFNHITACQFHAGGKPKVTLVHDAHPLQGQRQPPVCKSETSENPEKLVVFSQNQAKKPASS